MYLVITHVRWERQLLINSYSELLHLVTTWQVIRTVDIYWVTFADGRRHIVTGYAKIDAHLLSEDPSQFQGFAQVRLHSWEIRKLLLTNKMNDKVIIKWLFLNFRSSILILTLKEEGRMYHKTDAYVFILY